MTTGTIEQVDPATLVVAANIRKDTKLTKGFLASIKEHGVLVPITAHKVDGKIAVIDGQRRTLAAVDAGVKTVPVYVTNLADEKTRVLDQLVVNENRADLSEGEAIAAVKQLELFGMTSTVIAKKTGYDKETVERAIAVASNETSAAAVAEHEMTLDQAAVLIEFDGDKDAVKQLTETAKSNPHNFAHKAESIRKERSEAGLKKELTAQLKKAKVPLAAKPNTEQYSGPTNKHKYLVDLVDKVTGKAVTLEEHAACEGHAAFVGTRGYYGSTTEIHFVCTDPSKFGHRDKNKTPPTPLTDEQKAERAVNAAIGKQWPAVVEVRQSWIREQLLTRKKMPAGWEKLVALVALEEAGQGGSWDWGPDAAKYLQLEGSGYGSSLLAKWSDAHPTKAAFALVAFAVARFELSVGNLRSAKGWQGRRIAEYLTMLSSWGYGLSEVEQELVDGQKAKAA